MLIGNTGLLCTQCKGIGPHLAARGKSHGFSRVAKRTWGIFSSYTADAHSKLEFFKQGQHSSLVTMDTSGIETRLGRTNRILLEVRRET